MNNEQYIRELASGDLSLRGYVALLDLNIHMIYKYKWPVIILDESTQHDYDWSKDNYVSFFHQMVQHMFQNKKLKHLGKIPDSYVEYYFKKIIVSYVARKIREKQSLRRFSFDSIKRIGLQILRENYFSSMIGDRNYWYTSKLFPSKEPSQESIEELVNKLPAIIIKNDYKQIKPLVRLGLDDIFSLINKPIEEQLLIKLLYSLFEKSSESDFFDDDPLEINMEGINKALKLLMVELKTEDIPIIKKYFFNQEKVSMQDLANEFEIPKSTIHKKVERIKLMITSAFTPCNDLEGIEFLKMLEQNLDDKG